MPESDLLAQILAEPENDAPRLAYAELLEERSDPRGEFIKVQLRIAEIHRSQGSLAELARLTPRQRKLLAAHEAEWTKPVVRAVGGKCRFYRGFVDAIEVDARWFLRSADAIYKVAPVLHVALRGANGAMQDLCRSPALRRLVSMELFQQGIGDDDVQAIAASPNLGRLAWLDLRENKITEAGLAALATSTNLPRLRWVGLTKNGFPNPSDEWDETEGSALIHFSRTAKGIELESRYGEKPWLHWRPSDTMFWPPSPVTFVGG